MASPRTNKNPTSNEESKPRPPNPHKFLTGDMVWGKVKSHPWWPGFVLHESLASPSILRTKIKGFILIAFFGDNSYGWLDPCDLIPYEPNFLEKSKQTTSKSFLNAVDESVDEVSRRAAVGVTCKCRNESNFRRVRKVRDYFEVDVVAHERNVVYSRREIERERNGFEVKDLVGFLRGVAVGNRGSGSMDVEWFRNVGMVRGLRSALFEEHDEPYYEAFGKKAVKLGEGQVTPLKDQIKSAEKKNTSSTASSTHYKERVKKNEHVLKQRDSSNSAIKAGAASTSSPSLTNASYFSQKQTSPILNDSNAKEISSVDKYVLRKLEPINDFIDEEEMKRMTENVDKDVEAMMKMKKQSDGFEGSGNCENSISSSRLELANVLTDLLSLARDQFYGVEDNLPITICSIILNFRTQVYSKSPDYIDAYNEAKEKVKLHKHRESSSKPTTINKKPVDLTKGKAKLHNNQESSSKPMKISKEPVHLTKQKSRLHNNQESSSKSSKISREPDDLAKEPTTDLTKPVLKRAPSDRLEEISKKKVKKVTQLKSLIQETSDSPKFDAESSRIVTEKQETAIISPPMKETSTYLIMRFPPRSPLPSVPNLKARFARYGTIVLEGTRIFWNTHSCRVQFKHESNAIEALNFVKNNDVFGQFQVDCSIRAVEAVNDDASEPSEPKSILKKPSSIRVIEAVNDNASEPSEPKSILKKPESILKKPGSIRVIEAVNDHASEPSEPKSILKKPGNNESGIQSQRVKFMLSKTDSPPSVDVAPKPALTSKSVSFRKQSAICDEEKRSPPVHVSKEQSMSENVDISHALLSLMMKCNDLVMRVKAEPGFALHRAL